MELKKPKSATDASLNIIKHIVHDILKPEFDLDDRNCSELITRIWPIIANAMHQRDLEVIEYERLISIIKLSKGLSIEETEKAIFFLGYKINPECS